MCFFLPPFLLNKPFFFPVFFVTESSKSITPALVLSKFLQSYEEMAQEAESDPWISVLAWVEHPVRAEWDIKSGVNFMQFVDCLGVRTIYLVFLLLYVLNCSNEALHFSVCVSFFTFCRTFSCNSRNWEW